MHLHASQNNLVKYSNTSVSTVNVQFTSVSAPSMYSLLVPAHQLLTAHQFTTPRFASIALQKVGEQLMLK